MADDDKKQAPVPKMAAAPLPTWVPKQYDHVVAAVELKSEPGEWPWIVAAGLAGYVKVPPGQLVEVQFANGVIRHCKPSELKRVG